MAKILLVEDDNNLREIYEARLQAEGYETATASDGEQALVVAKEAKPDLVISDVMMPKISGFEMLDILRNTDGLKDVKVIMLTALGQSEDKSRADQLGADKYLVKSQVTLEDIVKTAHTLLDGDVDVAPATVTPPVAAATSAAASQPAPEATAQPAATATNPQAVANQTASAASDQSATMAAQIDSFVAEPVATVDPAVTPAAEPVAAPDPQQAHDDQVMADAVQSLTGDSTEAAPANETDEVAEVADAASPVAAEPETMQSPSEVAAVEVEPPEPAAQPAVEPTADEIRASDDAVGTSHKKVIKPLNDPAAKPDINQLLQAEQAAEASDQPVPPAPAGATVQETPEVNEPPVDPSKPNPNDIAL